MRHKSKTNKANTCTQNPGEVGGWVVWGVVVMGGSAGLALTWCGLEHWLRATTFDHHTLWGAWELPFPCALGAVGAV